MVRELFGVTPDPWQDEVLALFPSTPRIAMKASKGPGKAQPKDTIIPTPAGNRRLGDLRVGDEVFAEDGSRTLVNGVYDRGVLSVYRVTFDDYSSTLACGEHLWRVRGHAERLRKCAEPYKRNTRQDEVWAVLTTEQILARGVKTDTKKGWGRQFEIPRQGAAQYRGAVLPLDPYLLGVWLGDGIRNQGAYATKPTDEIAAKLRDRGHDVTSPDRAGHKNPERASRVSVFGLMPKLRELGVLHLYSHERFVPEIYLHASEEGRRELICGLFDTDCGVDKDGHMQFAVTSPVLARQVEWLVRSLGGTAHHTKPKQPFYYYGPERQRREGRECYRVVVRTPFNPFSVPQRRERWADPYKSRATSRYMTRYIDAIEPAGEADCVCIAVEHPSRCYLTNDFIVTHNSAVLAWCCWNFLLTRPHPNVAATSISADNLRDGLWKEMAHWRNRSELLKALFEWQVERIFAKEHPSTWFMSARSWSKAADPTQLGNTLAGLHSDYIMFAIDESGAIPSPITLSAEAALSSCKEGHILQAGNTNLLEGALYDACVSRKHLWKVVQISGDPDDPSRSTRISLEWARDMVETYGRDSPFVKVAVLGEWPSASVNALLGPDDVDAAMRRQYQQHDIEHAARILGVDVAREGDDASVIYPRQGLVAFKPHVLRNVTGNTGAGAVARVWQDWEVDAVFVDNTGGFGAAWIDQLANLNRHPTPIGFAEAPQDRRYFNRRAEMYFALAKWVKEGGALPEDRELVGELCSTTYTFKGDRLLLEPKEIIKAKLGRSPDRGDALALTFAEPVVKSMEAILPAKRRDEPAYDAFAEFFR